MNGPSIIARPGLDSDQFNQGLASAQRNASQAGDRIAGAANRGAKGQDNLLESTNKVDRSMGSLASAITGTGSAAEKTLAVVDGLANSLNLGLGTAVAASIGVAVVGSMVKAVQANEELLQGLEKLSRADLSYPINGAAELTARITELQTAIGKVTEGPGIMGEIAEALNFTNSLQAPGKRSTGADQRAAAIADANKAKVGLVQELAKAEKDVADIQEKRLNGEERAADLAKVQTEFAQKRAKANELGGKAGVDMGPVLQQLQRQQVIAEEEVNRKHDAVEKEEAEKMLAFQKQMHDQWVAYKAGKDAEAEAKRKFELDQYRENEKHKRDEAEKTAKAQKKLLDDVAAHEALHRADQAKEAAAAEKKQEDAKDKFINDKMAGPDAARAAARANRRAGQLGRRFLREQALDALGDQAAANNNGFDAAFNRRVDGAAPGGAPAIDPQLREAVTELKAIRQVVDKITMGHLA